MLGGQGLLRSDVKELGFLKERCWGARVCYGAMSGPGFVKKRAWGGQNLLRSDVKELGFLRSDVGGGQGLLRSDVGARVC